MGQITGPINVTAGQTVTQYAPQGLLNSPAVVVFNNSNFALQVVAPVSKLIPASWQITIQMPSPIPGSAPPSSVSPITFNVVGLSGVSNGSVQFDWLGVGESPPPDGQLTGGGTVNTTTGQASGHSGSTLLTSTTGASRLWAACLSVVGDGTGTGLVQDAGGGVYIASICLGPGASSSAPIGNIFITHPAGAPIQNPPLYVVNQSSATDTIATVWFS